MKVNKFVFEEREESGAFKRVPTKREFQVAVSPYAETQRLDAVSRDGRDETPRAQMSEDE